MSKELENSRTNYMGDTVKNRMFFPLRPGFVGTESIFTMSQTWHVYAKDFLAMDQKHRRKQIRRQFYTAIIGAAFVPFIISTLLKLPGIADTKGTFNAVMLGFSMLFLLFGAIICVLFAAHIPWTIRHRKDPQVLPTAPGQSPNPTAPSPPQQ